VRERTADYCFAGSVRLRLAGSERALRHFDAEYGEGTVPPGSAGEPDVEVRIGFGLRSEPIAGGAMVTGGHKSARWRVALGPPDARPLRASIVLAGGPPSFALSLVQGYFVEALVAVALADQGRVALPSAGFAADDGVTVLLGRSGAGKTTLTARALAGGRTVLSDDQVVLDDSGRVWRYPRRLRLYPDIRETAPDAWSLLPAGTRSALVLRGRVRRLTRGYVAPSLAVPVSDIGAPVASGPLPLRRIVVVERAAAEGPTVATQSPDWVVEQAGLVLADQRNRLSHAVDGAWTERLGAALEAERGTVAAALTTVPATQFVLPRGWGASRAVDALDAHLGITRGRATRPGDRFPDPTR
jgi:hypothetical protein